MIHLPFRTWLPVVVTLLIAAGVSGCDRPFVEQSPPSVEIVSPDLTRVQTVDSITVRIKADSFRGVADVALNGLPMSLDDETGEWAQRIGLRRGLNALEVVATDLRDVEGGETFYAVKLPIAVSALAPALPIGLGGHAAVQLRGGAIIVTGGASEVGAAASGHIYVAPSGDAPFRLHQAAMRVARAGHTSMELPDGRVITVGGSRMEAVENPDDLVEEVELFDPASGQSSLLPVDGPPVRRAYHTASIRVKGSETLIDIHGGLGDAVFSTEPQVGVRDDLRVFRLEGDRLVARSPAVGPFLSEPIWGHTQTSTEIRPSPVPGRFLYHGARFSGQNFVAVCMTVDFDSDIGIEVTDLAADFVPRTRHAGVTVQDGLILLIGGRQAGATPLLSAELYVDPVGIFMEQPLSGFEGHLRRYGHTATLVDANRILLLGGFSSTGDAYTQSEYLILDP